MPRGVYKKTEEHKRNISLSRKEKFKKQGYLNTLETKEKMSLAHKGKEALWVTGENHWNWKGGEDNWDKKRYRETFLDKNRERMKEYARIYMNKRYWANIEESRKYARDFQKKRRKNITIRLNHAIHAGIYASLKGRKNREKWQSLVGYTIQELMKSLEGLFDSNMNWNNYGSYWVVDHRKPQVSFVFTSYEDKEFQKCWALNNLQPMEKIANMKKGARNIINEED